MQQSNFKPDDYLDEIYQKHKVTKENEKEFLKSIKSLIDFFEQKFNHSVFGSEIEYLIFGSFLNGFGTSTSDVDFTFVTNNYVNEKFALQYVAQIIRSIEQEKFQIEQVVQNARIAVLKIKDTSRKVEIDICFNNILGVINTELLKAYSELDDKVKKVIILNSSQGGILLKLWGKKAKVITKNLFSSYAILIMWLHFLQQHYNLPNLQDPKYKPKNNQKTQLLIKRNLDGINPSSFEADVFFVSNIHLLKIYTGHNFEIEKKRFQESIQSISLSEMLKNFFSYYSEEEKGFEQEYKISINKKELKETGVKYSMSDPFDEEHDPIKKIRNQFKQPKLFGEAAVEISNSTPASIKKLFDL